MNHHRSPTHNYPQNIAPIRATLALRHPASIPTLLSPLTSGLFNGDNDDDDDFFQSNTWVNTSSYRPPLAGLGITYLRDGSTSFHDASFAPEDADLQTKIDGNERLLLPAGTHGTDVPLDDFTARYESDVRHRTAHHAQNSVPHNCGNPSGSPELRFDSDIDPPTGDVIGLIPDVNMYDNLRRSDWPHPGVNPLDTIRNTSLHDIGISYGEPALQTPKDYHVDDMLLAMDSAPDPSPSPRVIQDIMSILIKPAPEFPCPSWSSVQSSSPSQHASASASATLEQPNVSDGQHHGSPAPYNLEYANSTHSSPVLNAHLGIELNELISRAERFRSKYPERDIDRAWLSHFAGKLSDRGELLNNFRCYVIGCDQQNKRRDHILVHVGAHIGQRPFACSVCPLRFLRKNECKRHEASHSGFRPYSCDICGQSFVRQDLVKRHVKRTHGVRDENEPQGYAKPSRKRARLH